MGPCKYGQPIRIRLDGSSEQEQFVNKRKKGVSIWERLSQRPPLKRTEDPRKIPKKSLSPFTSARVGRESAEVAHEKPASIDQPAPINSTPHLNGEKEVCNEGGRFSSFPTAPEWISSVSTLFRPEVSTALTQLPELVSAAQRSEQLERELDESRKENVELKGEKVELKFQIDELRRRGMVLADALTMKERELAAKERDFQALIERMELEKKVAEEKLTETQSMLIQTVQKANELLEITSPSNPK